MRKLSVIFILLCILMLPNSTASAAADTESIIEIGLNAFLNRVLTYDRANRIKEIEISILRGEAEEAEKNAENPERNEEISKEYKRLTAPMRRIWKEVVPLERRYAVDKLVREKSEYNRKLKEQAKYSYYRAVLLDQQLNIAKEDRGLASKEFELAKAKYDAGSISQIDFLNAEMAFRQMNLDYTLAVDDKNNAYSDIKNLIGFYAKEIILIPKEITIYELPEITPETFLDTIKRHNSIYLNALRNKEIKQMRYDIYKTSTSYPYDKQLVTMERELLEADIQLKKVEKEEVIGTYNEYTDLLNLKGDLAIAEKKLRLQKQKLDAAKVKLDNGLITELDYNKEALAYKKAGLKLKQDINEFNYRVGKVRTKLGL